MVLLAGSIVINMTKMLTIIGLIFFFFLVRAHTAHSKLAASTPLANAHAHSKGGGEAWLKLI